MWWKRGNEPGYPSRTTRRKSKEEHKKENVIGRRMDGTDEWRSHSLGWESFGGPRRHSLWGEVTKSHFLPLQKQQQQRRFSFINFDLSQPADLSGCSTI